MYLFICVFLCIYVYMCECMCVYMYAPMNECIYVCFYGVCKFLCVPMCNCLPTPFIIIRMEGKNAK